MIKCIVLFVMCGIVSGCSFYDKPMLYSEQNPSHDNAKTSIVIVVRPDRFINSALDAIIGFDDRDILSLENKKVGAFIVPIGKRNFFVRPDYYTSTNGNKFRVDYLVQEGKNQCFEIQPHLWIASDANPFALQKLDDATCQTFK